MVFVGWVAVLVIVLLYLGVIMWRALNQGRHVKAGVKIPFATFFFEAKDQAGPQPAKKQMGTGKPH
jgi:hypothetical protein